MTADPRFEHYRGPCRGDGHQRRSAEWLRQHDDALTRPCPFVIPAARSRDDPLRCGAEVGEECRDPRTARGIERQPAHYVRIYPKYATPAPAEESG